MDGSNCGLRTSGGRVEYGFGAVELGAGRQRKTC